MKTPDGVKLDGVFYEGSLKKAVIYSPGNAQLYGTYAKPHISFLSYKLGDISVLCFNPQGVLQSEGISCPEKLPYDVFTAFEYLIVEKNYRAQDIALLGFSLGGNVGIHRDRMNSS